MRRQFGLRTGLMAPVLALGLAGCGSFPAGDIVATSWTDPNVMIVNRAQRPMGNMWDDSGDHYIAVAINRDDSPVCVGLYHAGSRERFIEMWRVEPHSEVVMYPHEAPRGSYNRVRLRPGEVCPPAGP